MIFYKNKKIILISIIIVVLILGTAGFFLKKAEKAMEKKEKIKVEEGKQESHFLTKEEKENFGIDPKLKVKIRKAGGDLGPINVVEFIK
ncbi:MAG: hypothetical protein AAB740_01325 [Patescibacteria group bacterium]